MTIQTVAVVGAGQMGSGIAHVLALAGYDVTLMDVQAEGLGAALQKIGENMDRQVARNDRGRGTGARPRTYQDDRKPARARHERPHHRGGNGEGGGQAEDIRRSQTAPETGNDPHLEHVVDFDHAACRAD